MAVAIQISGHSMEGIPDEGASQFEVAQQTGKPAQRMQNRGAVTVLLEQASEKGRSLCITACMQESEGLNQACVRAGRFDRFMGGLQAIEQVGRLFE